ncbi:hypothetical protein niasHT_038162 [Heterodera trifolii]|uniref:Uncharacterized protein n=1 Tax=Heterodera trifolii TaxID=157864 RepID=A0ABD2I2F1_9BILA
MSFFCCLELTFKCSHRATKKSWSAVVALLRWSLKNETFGRIIPLFECEPTILRQCPRLRWLEKRIPIYWHSIRLGNVYLEDNVVPFECKKGFKMEEMLIFDSDEHRIEWSLERGPTSVLKNGVNPDPDEPQQTITFEFNDQNNGEISCT